MLYAGDYEIFMHRCDKQLIIRLEFNLNKEPNFDRNFRCMVMLFFFSLTRTLISSTWSHFIVFKAYLYPN